MPARLLALLLLLLPRLAPAGTGLPDLRLDETRLSTGIGTDLLFFVPNACELQPTDLCVGGPGSRKLLRFNVFAANQGGADLFLGVPNDTDQLPNGDPKWVYSQCHRHYHFVSFARYELRLRGGSEPVLTGQKRSFCVEDTDRDVPTAPDRLYCCQDSCGNMQGIQVGWGDLYPSTLPCQWIDITDGVAPGEYDLCVFLNTERVLPDADPNNDSACVPVTIAAPDAQFPPSKVKAAPPPNRRAKVGRRTTLTWRKHVRGAFRFQEVWFSKDDGQTWTFVAGGPDLPAGRADALPKGRNSYRWTVPADAATDTARVKVVVWSRNPPNSAAGAALQAGTGVSRRFRIVQ